MNVGSALSIIFQLSLNAGIKPDLTGCRVVLNRKNFKPDTAGFSEDEGLRNSYNVVVGRKPGVLFIDSALLEWNS